MLVLVSAVAIVLLGIVAAMTQKPIAQREREQQLATLHEVLPRNRYDNDLLADRIVMRLPAGNGRMMEATVYRATLDGGPSAVAFPVVAPDGYNGEIRCLMAVSYAGDILGVRVLRHRETPGLGDGIERRVSDWIDQFVGKRLDDPLEDGWAVRKDGGEFTQFTGATITPRAVVAAVQGGLKFYDGHRQQMFAGLGVMDPADAGSSQ